ncbi:STM4015 family protein [uncultured Streptomyces sp.]|uniref:STM4015 family protein n=1 Tax=uncultured Streptomyces sp. TaxID=174707 RepID=UPI0026256EF4|nr:STM4015 family protein [uncultured Streptomyces sp.]
MSATYDIDHPESFHGLPVFTLPAPGEPVPPGGLPEPGSVAWRLECAGYDSAQDFGTLWKHFADSVDRSRVWALLIGPWWDGEYSGFRPVVDLLVADADRFPALRALFLADVVSEECELSWLQMCDVTPVFEAYPLLEEVTVRGCGGPGPSDEKLRLRPFRHGALRTLRFESGGLPGHVVRALGSCELPSLERLELWLGVDWYGGDTTVDDLRPLLAGGLFPRLRHLGLQNSEIQDEIAAALASAPVVAQLESLSLAMGTLTDAGAEVLIGGQPLSHLARLDLYHHYVGEAVLGRLRDASAPAVVEADPGDTDDWDPEDEDDMRYVAVGE